MLRTILPALLALTTPALASSSLAIPQQNHHAAHHHCGAACREAAQAQASSSFVPTDCSAGLTNILPIYDPANLPTVEINVVFHIFRDSLANNPNPATNGFVPHERLVEQIEVLNEDFAGLNPNSQLHTDTGIRFRLATEDENGGPMTGVKRYFGLPTLFNDVGQYWIGRSLDPTRYLNVYVLGAPQSDPLMTGYISHFPTDPGAGSLSDRIVVRFDTVGRHAASPNYGEGHILTHEIGHYLGLFHTFESASGQCPPPTTMDYTTGDLIDDTPAHIDPYLLQCPVGTTFGCHMSQGMAPTTNFMTYALDACRSDFTPEQANRMRCALTSYRPMIAAPETTHFAEGFCMSAVNVTGFHALMSGGGDPSAPANNVTLLVEQMLPTNPFSTLNAVGYPIASPGLMNPLPAASGSGFFCIDVASSVRMTGYLGLPNSVGRFVIPIDLTDLRGDGSFSASIQAGETWHFQHWYRDYAISPAGVVSATSNLSNGVTLSFQ